MSAAHATPAVRDPRDIITEDALHVAPELLGLPLASPWRRGAAMAVDGILVAILANAPGALFGLAAALVLFRISAPNATTGGYVRRSVRMATRVAGAVVLFALVVQGWSTVTNRIETKVIPALEGDAASAAGGGAGEKGGRAVQLGGVQGVQVAFDVVGFRKSQDERQARAHAERVVSSLRDKGVGDEDIREAVSGLAQGVEDRPWLQAAADSVLSHLAAPAVASAGAGQAESPVPDSLAVMSERVRELEREKRVLASELAEAKREKEAPGLVARAATLVEDDLGLGLGWMGLYFTAAVALWGGRTPGKRLFRIRIVRLNGKPIGWWDAFERFGGYAAGVATGLLGFVQVFWDKNRQAIHDKISETAVVRD